MSIVKRNAAVEFVIRFLCGTVCVMYVVKRSVRLSAKALIALIRMTFDTYDVYKPLNFGIGLDRFYILIQLQSNKKQFFKLDLYKIENVENKSNRCNNHIPNCLSSN